ncbi:MAG: RluA family pseudouridine synthase [Bacteroidota bacterium]
MPPPFVLIVPQGKKRERLDLFLTHHVENATRTRIQQAVRAGLVLVDGCRVRASHRVSPGERIELTLPSPPPTDILPEPIPLDILYEDADLLVVNKPAGMVTHPAHGNRTGTLVNALLSHTRSLSAGGDPVRPGIVHRLDKDTSGLLVVARNERAHAALARQFALRTVRREYQAVVWGRFSSGEGVVQACLGRSRSDRKKMAVVEGGKEARTEYRVLEQFAYCALLRLRLRTGRTHQIRVHLAHIGHPVFGDPSYHGRRIVCGTGSRSQKDEVECLLRLMPRQALHARTLGFLHPGGGREMFFASPLPPDMESVLLLLRSSGTPPRPPNPPSCT